MPKAVRISPLVPASSASENSSASSASESSSAQFVSVALFSGIGLLISLIAVILGVQGAWY
jgi:hypothetical protein